MLTAISLGFVLGLRHAADPDHLAAIAAMVARERGAGAAARLGVAWGMGHSLMILVLGGWLVARPVAADPGWAAAAELGVAAWLLVLGFQNLRSLGRLCAPAPRRGDGARRSLALGLVHGLAGSAAVALLALAAMPTRGAALAYLGVFGVGTIAGMVALSLVLGLPAARAGDSLRARRWLVGASGVVSLAVGLLLAGEVMLG